MRHRISTSFRNSQKNDNLKHPDYQLDTPGERCVTKPSPGPWPPVPGPFFGPYNDEMLLPRVCAALLLALPAMAADLKSAVIVAPATLASPEKKAAAMLADEIEKRTRIRLPVAAAWSGSGPAILLGPPPARFASRLAPAVPGADGYRVQAIDGVVVVAGNDPRGTLFGAGALLRNLHMERDRLEVADDLRISTAPKYPLRGHQLGYRPKTNSYDGWSVPVWEQYMRDLAVFGTNAIELIPPRSDDDADSPHFPLPPMRDDGRDVAPRRFLRPRRLDLVSGHGPRLLRSRRPSSSRFTNGARSSANCRASTPSSSPAAIPATPSRNT